MPKHCLILPLVAMLIVSVALVGCTRTPQRLAPLPTPAPAAVPAFTALPVEQAIPQLIVSEREASRSRDLALLAQLWAEDARIVDSRGTEDAADDFTWPRRAAILDRYTLAVFPAPPPALESLPAPLITMQGDTAQAISGQDHWRFFYQDGRWWIAELQY